MFIYLSMITDENDRSLFEKLYTSYHDEMLRYARSLLHNLQDAEDIVHDAFFYAAKNIHKFSAPSCHNAYGLLVIIVRNLSRNKLKRDKRIPFEPLDDRLPDSVNSPEDIAVDTAAYSELMDRIGTLGQDISDVMLLRLVYGYTYTEISGMLGITQELARARVSRGRERLRSLFLKEGGACEP